MNDEQLKKRQAEEADRLRTDSAFAAAVISIHKDTEAELASKYAELAEAVVQGLDTNSLRLQIVERRAVIKAIEALTTEIAHVIARGRAIDVPDRA
jgi:hypothetical protein